MPKTFLTKRNTLNPFQRSNVFSFCTHNQCNGGSFTSSSPYILFISAMLAIARVQLWQMCSFLVWKCEYILKLSMQSILLYNGFIHNFLQDSAGLVLGKLGLVTWTPDTQKGPFTHLSRAQLSGVQLSGNPIYLAPHKIEMSSFHCCCH